MREPNKQEKGTSPSSGRTPQWLQGAQRSVGTGLPQQAGAGARGRATGSSGGKATNGAAGPRGSSRGATGRLPRVGSTKRKGVLGARLQEVSGRQKGRGLPRGGIPRQAGLSVDPNTLDADARRSHDEGVGRALKVVVIIVGVLLALVIAFLIAVTLLSKTPAFKIDTVEASDSAHVSADSIVRLAKVDDGATLLNVDTKAIEQNLQKNPWVLSAKITREFPDTLHIEVTERQPAYLVVMGSGNLGWYLGADNVWIEPTRIDASGNQAVTDAALSVAQQAGSVMIAGVPSTVSPVAGSVCTDSEILTVEAFQSQFSSDFKSQIVSYSAPDTNGVSCVLSDGIEVSLGSDSNIDTKETVIKQVLADYAGQITYLNVRVPSSPSYRGISGDDLSSGSGATGTSTEDGSAFSSTVADVQGKVESDSSDGSSSGASGSGGGISSGNKQGSSASGAGGSSDSSNTAGSRGNGSASGPSTSSPSASD